MSGVRRVVQQASTKGKREVTNAELKAAGTKKTGKKKGY